MTELEPKKNKRRVKMVVREITIKNVPLIDLNESIVGLIRGEDKVIVNLADGVDIVTPGTIKVVVERKKRTPKPHFIELPPRLK